MSLGIADRVSAVRVTPWLLHLCVGAGVYVFLVLIGDHLLQDPDTYWHIKVGQWIVDHGAVPYTDSLSFTRAGHAWMSNAWLSQVALAIAWAQFGWAGPVVLAASAVAVALVIFLDLMADDVKPVHRVALALVAFAVSAPHLLARPHVLALPVMVAWVGGLIKAVDRGASPPWLLLPLMALWANLHGGFVLGLALVAPIALEAVWRSKPGQRLDVAKQWSLFAFAALLASCCTPYLHNTLIAAATILNLGPVLMLVPEWRPADFGSIGTFEIALLGLLALALHRGVVLSLPRIALLLLLTHMALSHIRCFEIFAFLAPLAIAKRFGHRAIADVAADRIDTRSSPPDSSFALAIGMLIAAAALTITLAATTQHRFSFARTETPVAALDALRQRQRHATRIFNDHQFGGFLIAQDVPTFIDGRAELYGADFIMDYLAATDARRPDRLAALLDDYQIDATLLPPDWPATQLMDQMPGWRRLYADDIAVAHVRVTPAK